MGRRRKKIKPPQQQQQQEAVDRISDLPDGVVLHILSFLETRDAVRTSVLSRRWQLVWMHVPNLVFNLRHGSLDKPQMSSLYGTLFHHAAPKILKFSLHLDGHEWPLRRVNRLVRFAAKRHVEELVLWLSVLFPYILPDCIFSHESLRKLRLRGCSVRPPPGRMSWGSLRVLRIELGGLGDTEEVLSGCPSLESLILCAVRLYGSVHIDHKKMKTLRINHLNKCCENKCEVRVNAPQLEELEFLGPWLGVGCKLIDVHSLISVHLDFYFEEPDSNLDGVDTDPRKEIFQMVGHSKKLCLGSHFLMFLADREMIKSNPTLYSRDCLVLKMEVTLRDVDKWILGMFSLIHHSPNLARLIVDFEDYECECPSPPRNDGIAYTPKDGFEEWMSSTNTGRFLSNVKTIEIHRIVGKYQWITFVEILLKHSVILEKMIIFSKSFNAPLTQLAELAETLSTLPRSSPRAMVSVQEE